MTEPLASELRKQLEQAVRDARRLGEAGARAALRALAVHESRPYEGVSEDERALRRRLRAHGRQLGDEPNRQSGTQAIGRLVHEVAYEHWHRMLFARFLAENGLLVEPESGVPVSLEECAELAREGRGTDGWQVAESFAAEMLPRIFRPDDPALGVTLSPETRQALERLVGELPAAVFTASDSLGWTYQFWQADRKEEVKRSGVKIGADELPAVTQLFTENYMVRFLFHNTIGAWRAGRLLAERPELASGAASEAELAAAARIEARGGLDGYDFDYLRFVREPVWDAGDDATSEPAGPWRPAAGAFRRWPGRVADLRVLDPCCGSGHFLVEGLELLVRLRMDEEGIGVEEAVRAVLQDNLHGLEIDARCTQIAAFNLALTAWKMVGRPVELPPLQIACSGLALSATKQEWLQLAEGDQRLESSLYRLYKLFRDAPTRGSLIDPTGLGRGLLEVDFKIAERHLANAMALEKAGEERRERVVAAQGISRTAKLLAGVYDLAITNVPYLASGNQDRHLRDFAAEHHPAAKAELATVFVSRIFRWLGCHGVQAVVAPQNFRYQPRYTAFRRQLLEERGLRLLSVLGPGAFELIGGEVVNVLLGVFSAEKAERDLWMSAGDVSDNSKGTSAAHEKADLLLSPTREDLRTDGRRRLVLVRQAEHLEDPNARILFRRSRRGTYLGTRSLSRTGTRTADNKALLFGFWEVRLGGHGLWRPCQSTVRTARFWGGCESVIRWRGPESWLPEMDALGVSSIQGRDAWGRDGVVVSLMGRLPVSLYTGEVFDMNAGVVWPSDGRHTSAIWCYLSAEEYGSDVRLLHPQGKLTTATLLQVPFDLAHWQDVAAEKYPNGLPEPYSDDPTQWLFHGHPCGSVVWDEESKWTAHGPLRADASVLQVAVARLLGYRWPAELDSDMRLAAESREWVERCRELHGFADADGIVCLQAAAGELPAADRLRHLLAAAYGEEWSAAKEQELLAAAADGKSPVRSLDEWLHDRFFAEHCKLFHNRPFIWHIWDGRSDGFHALVNYHRLCGPDGEGRRTLEALAYRHLGEWIDRQRAAQTQGEEGADGRLAAAQELQRQLVLILEGEPPYDLFIRWRPLHEQPLGWAPNLDDGVRLNIRPFMRAELQSGGRKGAGILRVKPNIKWSKDRGKEPESLRPREDFPWFYSFPGLGPEADRTDYAAPPAAAYDGNRWNDLHYTRAAKEMARARAATGDARELGR